MRITASNCEPQVVWPGYGSNRLVFPGRDGGGSPGTLAA
jgi:hypothetical protein